jgi:hypothetical protein
MLQIELFRLIEGEVKYPLPPFVIEIFTTTPFETVNNPEAPDPWSPT